MIYLCSLCSVMVLQQVEGFQIRDILAFLPFNGCSLFHNNSDICSPCSCCCALPFEGRQNTSATSPLFPEQSINNPQSSRNAFSKSSLIAQLKSTATYWPFKSSSRVSLMKTLREERGSREDLLNLESLDAGCYAGIKSDPAFHGERKTEESSEIKGCLSIGRRDVCEKIRLTKG